MTVIWSWLTILAFVVAPVLALLVFLTLAVIIIRAMIENRKLRG